MFTPYEQSKLRAACSTNSQGLHAGKNNPDLERVIRDLMNTVPHKFHSESSLASRRFFDEPRPSRDNAVPMMSYVKPYK